MFFGKSTKEEVEARMSELGYTGTWDAANSLHLKTPILPAIRQSSDGTEVFFNQMIAQYLANAKEFASKAGVAAEKPNLDEFLRYGDGSPVDGTALKFAHQVSERNAAECVWMKKDILLIDNILVMHARRPFEGPRKVFASLVM